MLGGYAEGWFFQKNNILQHNFSKSLHGAVRKKGLTGERALRTERMTSTFKAVEP